MGEPKYENFVPVALEYSAVYALPTPKGGLDRLGIILSAICLVHCTVLPLTLAFLPVIGEKLFPSLLHNHRFHLWFAVILLGVGGAAFVQGFLHHRRPLPLALGILGTALLFLGALDPGHFLVGEMDHLVTIIGTLILLTAHFRNRRKSHVHTANCRH